MADSVVKLRVDSREYDSKIKRAADGLRAFGDNCKKAGESVSKADKDTLSYVQAIGKMETVNRTAKGKINEMTSAFTELSVQYKQLTDEEKKSPFGQALSQSLDQLKGRINESKAQLSEVNSELGNTSAKGGEAGGIINQLAGKFSITLDAVKLFNVGLQATQAALQVAKDAFFASEAAVDEWGRIVDSSKSLYEGFLNSINNGDISGFLGRIDQIVGAARAAYNELDRLGTMRTIQAPQISAQQSENDRLRTMIQTGRWISAPGRSSGNMKDGQVLTAPQIRALEKMLTNGVNNVVTLVGNEVKQTGSAIEAVYRRQGAELGMSVQEFKKGTSSMAEFDKRIKGAEAYNRWVAEHTTTDIKTGRQIAPRNVPKELRQYKGWDVFRVDGQRYNDLVQLIQQRDQQASQMYNMQGQAYRTINRADGITTRSIMGRGGGGRTGGKGGRGGGGGTVVAPPPVGSIAEQEAKVQALTKAWREATDQAGRDGYLAQLNEAKAVLEQMQGKTKVEEIIPEGSFKALNKELKDLMAQRELLSDPMEVAIMDDQINEVREKIDELNGKTIKVSVEVPKPPTLEFQIRTKMAEDAIAADANALRNLLEVTIKNEIGDISLPPDTLERLFAGLDVPSDFMERIIRDGLSGVDILGNLISGQYGEVMNVPDEVWQGIVDQINRKLKEKGLGAISLDMGSGNVSGSGDGNAKASFQTIGDMLGRISSATGSIVSGLNDLGVKIPEGISKVIGTVQVVAGILTGISALISIITAIQGTKAIPIIGTFLANGGIARAASGLLTGNHMSGDNVPVMVNDGELILNRAQQGVLADALRGNAGAVQLEARIHGEDIVLATRNVDRRRGKGEVVRSR